MTRPARPRKAAANLSDLEWSYLSDASIDAASPELWALEFNDADFAASGKNTAQLWAEYGPAVLEWWIIEHAGTRPTCWWKFAAPGHRRRLGGVGTPSWEGLPAIAPRYTLGVPMCWIGEWEVEYFTGKARHVRTGELIAPENVGKPFAGVAIDPANPPMFESEAAYLDRLGLLLPGEHRRLTNADFEPQPILDIL